VKKTQQPPTEFEEAVEAYHNFETQGIYFFFTVRTSYIDCCS